MARTSRQRLNINLPPPVLQELKSFATSSHRTMSDVLRDGFALAKLVSEEAAKGNKLAVTDPLGNVIKELVITR